MSEMALVYAMPNEALQDCISFYYQFDCELDEFVDKSFRADIAQFMFVLRGHDGYVQYGDEAPQPMVGAFILGPSSMNGCIGGKGPASAFGMGITPTGWLKLMPQDAASMKHQVADAAALFGNSVARDHTALRDAPDFAARVAIADEMMSRLLTHEAPQLEAFISQVNAWLAASFSPEIDDLEATTGLSRSQLARRCNQIYGAPPKVLVRKYRALRAAVRIANGEASPLDFLAEGFYDQPHLIREIKHFTGHTPMELRNNPTEMLRLTLQRTRFPGISALIT